MNFKWAFRFVKGWQWQAAMVIQGGEVRLQGLSAIFLFEGHDRWGDVIATLCKAQGK